MKKKDIKVGGVYRALVNGKVVPCRVDAIRDVNNYPRKTAAAVYDVTNLTTGRKTTFRSAMKFREEVAAPVNAKCDRCRGCGSLRNMRPCPDCRGTGKVSDGEKHPTYEEALASIAAAKDDREQEAEQRPDPTPASLTSTTTPKNGTPSTTSPFATPPARPSENPSTDYLPASSSTSATSTSPTCSATAPNANPDMSSEAPLASVLNAPHLIGEALAGTGKTTTCVVGLQHVKGLSTGNLVPSDQQRAIWDAMGADRTSTVRISSFASKITEELRQRCQATGLDKRGVQAQGIHSLGYAAARQRFGKLSADSAKWVVPDITCKILGTDVKAVRGTPLNEVVWAVDELVSLCKQTLTDPTREGLDALTSRFGTDVGADRARVYELVPQVLEACRVPNYRITFNDMIWLALIHDLPIDKVDLQIVDESQDLNRMQQELMLRAGHRFMFVGDRHQAIYGFAGADAESMDRVGGFLGATARGCKVLPLTMTRRCGKAIVREAQRFVPEYEAHPSNPEGSVERADLKEGAPRQYRRLVQPGDMVLCRCNAPLVSQCLRFVKDGTKAQILGKKDTAAGLITLLDKSKASTTPDLLSWLGDWLAAETANEQAKRYPSEGRIENLQDRHDCIAAFCEGQTSVDGVRARIASVFTDNKDSKGVSLSSIHKSKGLEAQRVFILQPKGVGPREDKMQPWELEQERNLRYVSITRAIEVLTYVS